MAVTSFFRFFVFEMGFIYIGCYFSVVKTGSSIQEALRFMPTGGETDLHLTRKCIFLTNHFSVLFSVKQTVSLCKNLSILELRAPPDSAFSVL